MFNLFLLGCEFVFKGGAPGPINNFVKTSFFHHSGNKLAQFTPRPPRPPRPQFEIKKKTKKMYNAYVKTQF